MGTRHLSCAVIDEEYKVAQYGQWDGYPSGQGITILEFLRDEMDKDEFLAKLRDNVKEVTPEQHKQFWVDCGADPDSDMVSLDVSDKFRQLYPSLSRDTGGAVFSLIHKSDSDEFYVRKDVEFAGDSLFCEYAYVVDFDKNTFEVYVGFNKEPVEEGERFASFKKEGEYHPIRHWKTFDLDNLPTNEEFLDALKEGEDEEE